ncbi:unnamed protein product [Caretta caretta]
MENGQTKPFAKCAASWPEEHSLIFLVNLWCEASKTVDFSKNTWNNHAYQQIVKKLTALQIYQTSDQCRECIKWLKNECEKTRDHNRTLGNSSQSCPFYQEFAWVVDPVPSMQPTMVCDDLVSWNGTLLAPEPSMGAAGSQH